MANKNKSKGSYHERRIEEWLKASGFEAERQPLSGSLGGKYRGDIKATINGHELVIEVKYRDKSNFPSPYSVLEDRDMAIYKRRNGKPQTLVIMTDEIFLRLLGEQNHDSVSGDHRPDHSTD